MRKNVIMLSVLLICFALVGCNQQVEKEKTDANGELIQNETVLDIPENENILNDTTNESMMDESKTEENEQAVENEVEEVSIDVTSLDNKTYAWGFRRMKDGVQPEFTASYAKVLDDYNGIYVGNKEDKVVYLTFDEGYENGYTGTILDTLKEKDVEATFFVTTPYVKKNADLVQRMIDEGHIVGNHTVNHPSMPSVTDDEKLKNEIMGLHDYVKENFGYDMTFLRPPKGEYSERTVAISKNLGYTTVLWSQAYDDWDVNNQKGVEYAKKMILNNLHNGAVILLHAVSKDNTEVLGEVIDEIRNRGYEIRSLEDFMY